MVNENSVSHNAGSSELKWIDQKYVSMLYILTGFLLLIVAPYAMTMKSGIFNDDVLIVNTAFSLIVIALGLIEFLNVTGRTRILGSLFPVLMLILGVVTIFLYSHFYDTPWDQTYHLYIVNITSSGVFHIAYYKARDTISEMSSLGGVIIVLGALYELLYRKMA